MPTILVSGATGFIGAHVAIALVAAGHTVRCATRNPAAARARRPELTWVELDLERPATIGPAFAGCDVAIYLVHAMDAGIADYPAHERRGADAFADAAATAHIRRIIYLGGVLPKRGASRHLRSRQATGARLRAGTVETIELRAAMIIGAGSASWRMVRDLAQRLPAMLLPRWLRNVSYPIAVEDVVAAIALAVQLPPGVSRIYELAGPERISHRAMLERTAAAMGHKRVMISVPVLTPRLSSYWIALVTRTSLELAKELVEGVRYDLEPSGEPLWPVIGHQPIALDDAIARALADDAADVGDGELPTPAMRARLVELGAAIRGTAVA